MDKRLSKQERDRQAALARAYDARLRREGDPLFWAWLLLWMVVFAGGALSFYLQQDLFR